MLPDKRRRCTHLGFGAAHPPRDSAMLIHADFRMVEVNPVAALLQMSIFRNELVRSAYRGRYASRLEDSFRLGGAALRGSRGHPRLEFVLVALARGRGGKARIARQ